MKKLLIIDIVGLTNDCLKMVNLPNISKILEKGTKMSIVPSFPAVTCSVQSTITSGTNPSEHGIIANGYYNKNTKEVSFWEQYSSLVEKPRIWEVLKNNFSDLKTAVLFFQNSLYTDADIVITPKPIHLENQLVMWCYSKPENYYEKIVKDIGEFDLKSYWGPFASIKSSNWIIEATKHTIKNHKPDLLMTYVPHLDYAAQKNGPTSTEFKQSLLDVDNLIGELIEFLNKNNLHEQYEIMLISEYGFTNVNHSISPNIILREAGFLKIRNIAGAEYIDFENSNAFAMVDHQIAHLFIKAGYEDEIKDIFEHEEGIASIHDRNSQKDININHNRSGELILVSKPNSWFNYYWWTDKKLAPPFAFTVDIHRKPGYDPLELFIDFNTKTISQNTSLIKGSHGIVDKNSKSNLPILITTMKIKQNVEEIDAAQIFNLILKYFQN